MSILTISLPGDTHALSVNWALRSRGVDARMICWSDFPQALTANYSVADDDEPAASFGNLDVSSISTIWNHRTIKAVPPPAIDRADHQAIRDGADHFVKGLVALVEERAFAVNSSAAKWFSDNKLTQLRVARQIGFRIPATLISNDIGEIKAFTQRVGGTILKPLRFMRWRGDQETITLYTDRTPDLDVFNPLSIRACPMIYQQEIKKKLELRVVVFGGEILAFELHSQESTRSECDWRAINYRDLPARLVALNPETCGRVTELFRLLGLVSGSVDLAIDEDGEFIFFEVNETGQFLWLEEICRDVPLLDMFTEFLLSASPNFRYDWTRTPMRLETWQETGTERMRADLSEHVETVLDKRYPDFAA